MQTGALIVAAGMSSRMGDFKPMLEIGSISIAKRIVANFRQAGVEKIVMVTGHNADMLEKHLFGQGIIFLRNENYETTQMFDSAKIGLEYLKDKVDIILFTPVDIPLFTASTLDKLILSDAKIACPVCEGQQGHPIKIDSSLVDIILEDDGMYGLKGALNNCGEETEEIEVDDPGVLHDADTPEDYTELLKLHNASLARPEVEVCLSREVPFFSGRIAMLLSLINETGSVRTACTRMQISYSTGWNLIRTLENQMTCTLVERFQGGSHGGKSHLTDEGKKLVGRYNEYFELIREYASEHFDEYFGEFFGK